MSKLKMILLLVAGAVVLWGAPALADQELMVSAAASLTNALREVAGQFEKTHPGAKIVCNFAASGVLLQQMAQGRPGGRLRCRGSENHEPGPGEKPHRSRHPEEFCQQPAGAHRARGFPAGPQRPQGSYPTGGEAGGGGQSGHRPGRALCPNRPGEGGAVGQIEAPVYSGRNQCARSWTMSAGARWTRAWSTPPTRRSPRARCKLFKR